MTVDAVWTFGDVRVTQVTESVTAMPGYAIFPSATVEAVEGHREWLYPHYIDDHANVLLAVQSLLIESCGTKIVVDTCMGNEPPESLAAAAVPGNQYLDDIAAAGFEPSLVDLVLCTHLHADHVGWNTRRVGECFLPTFANARYLIAEPALAAWLQPVSTEAPSNGTPHSIQPLLDAGLVDGVPLNHRLTEHVWLESTPGHSRGHVSVWIESRGSRALITGDLLHHPVQWAEPSWGQVSDVDTTASCTTRQRILDEYANTDVTIIGTHFPAPAAGKLVRVNGVGRFVPNP